MKPRVYIQVERTVRAWGGWRLLGKVWGHPEIQDGHTALTSRIIESRRMRIVCSEVVVVETENTQYVVMNPGGEGWVWKF